MNGWWMGKVGKVIIRFEISKDTRESKKVKFTCFDGRGEQARKKPNNYTTENNKFPFLVRPRKFLNFPLQNFRDFNWSKKKMSK